MKIISALIGLLGGLLVAIMGLSLYYIVQFKRRWSSFLTTVGASVVGMVLSFTLSSFALRKIFPVDSDFDPKTAREYMAGFFLGGVVLGTVVLGRVLAFVRERRRYRSNAEQPSKPRWFDVPPPSA